MSETLQKGWLTTRDGQKYAPATLVENVYTRSGKPYDERVREYIAGLQSNQGAAVAGLQETVNTHDSKITALQNKTANFGDNGDDKLYIVDSADNIIAYIDGTGVNSVDFTSPIHNISLSGLSQLVEGLNTTLSGLTERVDEHYRKLENLNVDENTNQLFIIDSQNNVVAYIDANGIHATNFWVDPDQEGAMDYWTAIRTLAQCVSATESLRTDLSALSQNVDTRLANFDGNDDGNSLFIIDSQNNVIAYVDSNGVHSIDFIIENEDKVIYNVKEALEALFNADSTLDTTLRAYVDNKVVELNTVDNRLGEEIQQANEDIDALQTKTENLDSSENTDGLYITDGSGMVVAYINATGLHTIDVFVDNYDANGNVNYASVRDIETRLQTIETWVNSIFATWQNSINDSVNNLQQRLQIQEQVTGETVIPAKSHVVRLNELEEYVGLSDSTGDSLSERLSTIETLVGEADDSATENTHEGRIKSLSAALLALEETINDEADRIDASHNALSKTVNYLGEFDIAPTASLGDLAVIGNTLQRYNGSAWENYEGLSKKLYYLDGSESGVFYFTDKSDNVIAFVDNSGITTVDVVLKTLKYENNTWSVATGNVNGNATTSLVSKIAEILNDLSDHNTRVNALENTVGNLPNVYKTRQNLYNSGNAETNKFINQVTQNANGEITVTKSSVDFSNYYDKNTLDSRFNPIEDALDQVTKVMDFRGAFETKPTIKNGNYQDGDVIVITSGNDKGKEFVCSNGAWVEFGNSDATSTAIAKLQEVTGHNAGLNSGELSHHAWLDDHEGRIDTLETEFDAHVDNWDKRTITVTATDDNIVDLTASGGKDTVTINASHKKVAGASKGATHTKITYDDYGHVTGGSTPTTLAGYSITDAVDKTTYNQHVEDQERRDDNQDISHNALASALNYRGEFTTAPAGGLGDIAVINNVLSIHNGTSWETFNGLSKKLYYLDGSESGVFYFTDKSDNVVAYVDANGVTATNVILPTLKQNTSGTWSVVSSGEATGTFALSNNLATILNDIITIKSDINSIKENYQLAGNYKTRQNSVTKPTNTSGTALNFVDGITQNANGEVAYTTKAVNLSSYYTKAEVDAIIDPIEDDIDDLITVGVPKWNDTTTLTFTGDVTDVSASFDGSETSAISVTLAVKDDSHSHTITCSGSGDSKAIEVENAAAQKDKVAFTVKHKDILTTTGYSSGVAATSKKHSEDITFKVPKLTLDDLGHIKTIADQEITFKGQQVLTIGNITYNGDSAKTVDEDDIVAAGGVGKTSCNAYRQTVDDRFGDLRNDVENGWNAINYRGDVTSTSLISNPVKGDLAIIDGALKRYTGTAWENYEGLSKKLYYLDGTESGVWYFTDKSDNVVAFVDQNGITTTEVILKTLKQGSDGKWSIVNGDVSSSANVELADTLKTVLNDIIDLKASSNTHKTKQSSKSDPTAANATATEFISNITQNENGEITATKKKLPNYQPAGNYKTTQAAKDDPTANGSTTAFIATITQNANGEITATKKSVDFSAYQPKGNYKTTQSAVNNPSASGTSTTFIKSITQNTNGVITATAASVDFTAINSAIDNKKDKQSAKTSPSASGSTTAFIDTITQNENGVITATKKNIDFSNYYTKSDVYTKTETNNAITTAINPLQNWQDNWDAKAGVDIDDKIYFVDKNNNTIAYFDNDGLTVTNINLRTPNVPSGSTANAIGQSAASMIFFKSKGTISVSDSIL